jgi:hypothetical protein
MPEVVLVVRLLFGALGWEFNDKCVFEPSKEVIYNGMWIDSVRFEIRATAEKIELARKLAWKLWFAARDGEPVAVIDLQRLTGRLQSMKLALEGVGVWTRGIYLDLARANDAAQAAGGYLSGKTRLRLSGRALEDLNFWAYRLGKQNGLAIRDEGAEVHLTLRCDASDVGWGAHSDDQRLAVAGELPVGVLGESSTARELAGVVLMAWQLAESLRNQRICLRMDSLPAIRNLINGGGPVAQLNDLVREWWCWCKEFGVQPRYEWIPREQNQTADDLSKLAAASLTLPAAIEADIRTWLEAQGQPGIHAAYWRRTRLHTPHFDKVAVRLAEMRRARQPGCIVVPRWTGQTWWPNLLAASAASLPLGRARDLFVLSPEQAGKMHLTWWAEAHLVIPELRASAC